MYGMQRLDARFGVGEYVRLAWRVVNELPSANDIEDDIREIGVQHPISVAVDAMRGANFYENREDELRYIMFRYEENLAREQGLNFQNEQ